MTSGIVPGAFSGRHFDGPSRQLFVRRLLRWHRDHGRHFPWRRATDPFQVLVAEFMLQRTTSSHVEQVYDAFLDEYPSPSSIARSDPDRLGSYLYPLGLRKRVPILQELMATLETRHDSNVPRSLEALLALPGVGLYTAKALICFAFGYPVGIVDANVIRVFERVFGFKSTRARPRTDPDIWTFADHLVSKTRPREYNWALLDWAVTICRSKSPRYDLCPFGDFCCRCSSVNFLLGTRLTTSKQALALAGGKEWSHE